MVDDRVERLFECLDCARVFAARAAAAFGALHAFPELLKFPFQRIECARFGMPVFHVVLRLVDALGEMANRGLELARHLCRAAFAAVHALH